LEFNSNFCEAELHVDRLSVNIELPSEDSLRRPAGDNETHVRKVEPVQIRIRPRAGHRPSLFESCVEIACDPEKAERVWRGLKRHLGSEIRSQIHQAYPTGEPDVETLIYRRIRPALPLSEKGKRFQRNPPTCSKPRKLKNSQYEIILFHLAALTHN
jgi:hypothetical protein